MGRLFQIQGPWMAKLRSPYFVLVLGTTSSAVASVKNEGDDGQCTLTSTHSMTTGIAEPHRVDTCMPELLW